MHDPYVLPMMKQAFKEESLKHLKQELHDLLGYQYEQTQHCVESFSASISSSIVLRKEVGNVVTVAQQTAIVLRVLKVAHRFSPFFFCTVPSSDYIHKIIDLGSVWQRELSLCCVHVYSEELLARLVLVQH
jgi:hypothetical protein